MSFSNESFLQNYLETQVQTGMLVVDGRAGNGQKTRFLASHVGKDGMVLSFHEEREEANKTAASLFMAGLQDRVTVENGVLSAEGLQKELGRLTKVDLIILDYTKAENISRHQINAESETAWSFIKDDGQLIILVKAEENVATLQSALEADFDGTFGAATFSAKDGSTLLFEKEQSVD